VDPRRKFRSTPRCGRCSAPRQLVQDRLGARGGIADHGDIGALMPPDRLGLAIDLDDRRLRTKQMAVPGRPHVERHPDPEHHVRRAD